MDLARTRRGHVVELERTSRDRQIYHQKKTKSFRGLITATLPSFPGLISPAYGNATSLSGTLPAKTGEPQFHM
eukprot:7139569-Prymnesium_polylepis.1